MTENQSLLYRLVGGDAIDNATGEPSIRAHLAARLFSALLDKELAVRAARPAGSALHQVHAARLESDDERHAIAGALRRAVVAAHHGHPLGSAAIPVHRDNIVDAEDVIDTITLWLHSPRHVSATGMARLRLLLADRLEDPCTCTASATSVTACVPPLPPSDAASHSAGFGPASAGVGVLRGLRRRRYRRRSGARGPGAGAADRVRRARRRTGRAAPLCTRRGRR